MLLVGCKSDLRTDVSTLVELSNHRQTPVSYDQVCAVPFFVLWIRLSVTVTIFMNKFSLLGGGYTRLSSGSEFGN